MVSQTAASPASDVNPSLRRVRGEVAAHLYEPATQYDTIIAAIDAPRLFYAGDGGALN
jgi:hypothetical protein